MQFEKRQGSVMTATPFSTAEVVPASSRPRATSATSGVVAVERANALIIELGIELDHKLRGETRSSERLRMLRETTNQITRAANDAVQAFVRTKRMLEREIARDDARSAPAQELLVRLGTARRDLLASLEHAGRRYPQVDATLDGTQPAQPSA
jgi:hypothetical protein